MRASISPGDQFSGVSKTAGRDSTAAHTIFYRDAKDTEKSGDSQRCYQCGEKGHFTQNHLKSGPKKGAGSKSTNGGTGGSKTDL